ncbi:MAG: flagellar export protein FliJ [Desulfuromonadales bacterium]|nr:flagellar export protein FliJ [Desulfuromonadales bacterium]MBN2792317.1 flagellar export protein FliJ [Desulfuromonadales bacterium]
MAGKFKLQAVLNYRQSLEDQAQQALTASLKLRGELDAQREQQSLALRDYDAQLKARQREGLSVAEMELFEAQIEHCRRLMKDIGAQLDLLDERIVEERESLLKVARDRQVLEKLKDKQESEYRLELSRKERVMLDEISLRNKGESS